MLSHCFKKALLFPSTRLTTLWGRFTLLALLSIFYPCAVTAQPQLALDVEQSIKVGSAVWLTAGERFLSIYTPNLVGETYGGAIILHDSGEHPQWPDVIAPLRTQLPLHGWATHALHMTQLTGIDAITRDQESLFAQITAVITDMHSKGIANLVIIGRGTGATLAAHYLANNPDTRTRGLIAISLPSHEETDSKLTSTELIENLNLPIFDIYGSNDLTSVTANAKLRALAARKAGSNTRVTTENPDNERADIALAPTQKTQGFILYRQVELLGANHNFKGYQEALTRRTIGWLKRHAKGIAVTSRQK